MTVSFDLRLSSKGSSTGAVTISLPFDVDQLTATGSLASNNAGGISWAWLDSITLDSNDRQVVGICSATGNRIELLIAKSGAAASTTFDDTNLTNDSRLAGTVTYFSS